MNNDFTDGFEKIAWNPFKGVGQARRAIRKANKKVKSSVSDVKNKVKDSYNEGLHGELRAKRMKAVREADPAVRAAHTKNRLADVRKKDWHGNINPFQHKNTAAKAVAGGTALAAGAGYAGHKSTSNNRSQQQVMMRRRAY